MDQVGILDAIAVASSPEYAEDFLSEIARLRAEIALLKAKNEKLANPATDRELNGDEFTYREWLGYHEG